jgi:glycosyltransferase involved in cell wall biosynthesis
MKVLQVLPSLSAGGAEGFVTNLSVSLKGLGIDVGFYLLGGVHGERGQVLHERLTSAGIEVMGVRERHPAALGNLIQLGFLLRSWRPDIVQANLYPAEVACAVARFLVPGRRIRYLRRLANTDFVGYRSPAVVRMMDRFYPDVVACSQAVADAYHTFMDNRQRARLTTIPNGGLLLDAPPGLEAKLDARRSLGIAEHAFVVAHIGRMFGGRGAKQGGLETGQKAHDILIRAFAQAFAEDLESVLILVGDGPLRSDAEALAGDLGITPKTRFLGQLPEPWPALIAADVLCFPSRYEGLPNVLPEAASAGLPVVASDIPEIRDLSPHEGWLLAPVDDVAAFAEALRRVRDDMHSFSHLAHLGAAGFRERFSLESCARKYLHAYRAIRASEMVREHDNGA